MWYYFKSEEPGKLASWYKKWLGFYMESENPSSFKYVLMPGGSFTVRALLRVQLSILTLQRRVL